MRLLLYISLVLLMYSCSVQRFLPEGEKLYKGEIINIQKPAEVKKTNKTLKSEMAVAIRPRKNRYFLGQPWKVWWYYQLGQDNDASRFKNFLRRRLAEEPVLSNRVNATNTAANMQSWLDNNGYFRSKVSGDTINQSYFTKAVYNVYLQPQYTINAIQWVNDSSKFMKALVNAEGNSVLKVGNPYSLSDIQAERSRLDLYMKTQGYYFFNPDFIMSYVDSTLGNRKVNLYLNVKNTTTPAAKVQYKINNVTLYPNYSLASANLDTSRWGEEMHDRLLIRDTVKKFKPLTFTKAITYRPGSIYDNRTQNASLNRLISLGAFKFVKNRYEKAFYSDSTIIRNDTVSLAADTLANALDVYYYLTPSPKKSLQSSLDAFTKDNNYMGAQVSLNFINRNAFRGAEQLILKPYAGFEKAVQDSLSGNNNFRIGGTATLRIPRYAVPFLNIKENNFYMPNTSISLGYEWYRRNLYYTKNSFSALYEFAWKKNARKLYTLAPFSINYINASNVTDTFYKVAATSPGLRLSVFDETILGTYFLYSYSSPRPIAGDKIYYSFGVDLSGNIAGLITGAKSYRSKTLFGVPFAQYIKADAAYHYTKKVTNIISWANRVEAGYGLPYNNSRVLPFSKQYVIGGASTLRGFSTRSIGPGRHRPTSKDQLLYPNIGGDIRFLGNTELRFKHTNMFSTAIFIDAGNIWTKDTLTFGSAAKFTKNWYKELAVSTGAGLRIDLTFLLLRIDLGIPIRKPYLQPGKEWTLDFDISNRAWRRENLVLNFGIGLPF